MFDHKTEEIEYKIDIIGHGFFFFPFFFFCKTVTSIQHNDSIVVFSNSETWIQ